MSKYLFFSMLLLFARNMLGRDVSAGKEDNVGTTLAEIRRTRAKRTERKRTKTRYKVMVGVFLPSFVVALCMVSAQREVEPARVNHVQERTKTIEHCVKEVKKLSTEKLKSEREEFLKQNFTTMEKKGTEMTRNGVSLAMGSVELRYLFLKENASVQTFPWEWEKDSQSEEVLFQGDNIACGACHKFHNEQNMYLLHKCNFVMCSSCAYSTFVEKNNALWQTKCKGCGVTNHKIEKVRKMLIYDHFLSLRIN